MGAAGAPVSANQRPACSSRDHSFVSRDVRFTARGAWHGYLVQDALCERVKSSFAPGRARAGHVSRSRDSLWVWRER